MITELLQHN